MRWEERGEGLPVVFVHGLPTGPGLWRHVTLRVTGARTLAWEMVGYGQSIPQGEGRDISVARQAGYLATWIEQLGLGPVVAVGHDLGGGVVQNLAVKHPGLVRGMVLMNAISYDSWPIPAVKVMRAAGGMLERLPTRVFKQMYRTFLLPLHDHHQLAQEAFKVHWPHYEKHGGAVPFIRQARSLDVRDTTSISASLPDLGIPARIVWGAADQFLPIGYGYRLAYDLRAPLDRIEGGRHFVPEDHPDRVAHAVNSLLAQLGSAGH